MHTTGSGAAFDPLVAYLQMIEGGARTNAFVELRYRVAEATLAAEFFRVGDHAAVVDTVGLRAAQTDVYVGCAPRTQRAGTKDAVDRVWVLWAECDGAVAAKAAAAYRPTPPVLIGSGSGPNVHAYWPLRAPLSPPDAEIANLRLARAIGADEACHDAARILRPPTTWNHKRRPPAPVTVLRFESGVAFDAREIVARAPAIDEGLIARRWSARVDRDLNTDPLLRIPPVLYVGRLLEVPTRAGRKVRCPFHADERPSLHVYPTVGRGWCCFSCRRGGSIYDLAAALWNLDTRGADFVQVRRRLMRQFARELDQLARTPGPPAEHARRL